MRTVLTFSLRALYPLTLALFAATVDGWIVRPYLIKNLPPAQAAGYAPSLANAGPATLLYLPILGLLVAVAFALSVAWRARVAKTARPKLGTLLLCSAVVAPGFVFLLGRINARYLHIPKGSPVWPTTGWTFVVEHHAAFTLILLLALAAGVALAANALGRARFAPKGSVGRTLAVGITVLLWIAGPAVLAASEGAASLRRPPGVDTRPTGPNVVLIIVDTLRVNHISGHGYSRPTSPVMDRLEAGGIKFSSAYAPSSWTRPTVTSIMSGLAPAAHQCFRREEAMPPEARALAEQMRQAGYRTAAVSGNPVVSPEAGYSQGFDIFNTPEVDPHYKTMVEAFFARLDATEPRLAQWTDLRAVVHGIRSWFAGEVRSHRPANSSYLDAEHVTDLALGWLQENREDPFFLYVHYMDPHAPYAPPENYRHQVSPQVKDTGQVLPPGQVYFPPFYEKPASALDSASFASLVARYDGEIRYVDTMLERLLDALDENTLILLTSDHGEEFYDHESWGHGHALHQELIRVPLTVRPATGSGLKTGSIDQPVSVLDILPTILDLCNLPPVDSISGRSLANLMFDTTPTKPVAIFSEVLSADWRARSVVWEGFKLIDSRKGKQTQLQLFDLAADPNEQSDLANQEAFADRIQNMKDLLVEEQYKAAAIRLPTHGSTIAGMEGAEQLGYTKK